MKKTKKCVAVVLLIALLFSMNIASVFATDSLAESNPKVYAKGTNTLDLEGDFVANGSDGAIWVKDGAQLTINGTNETKVHATMGVDKYSMAVWAKANGTKVVINGGYYTNETDGSSRGTDLIYASDGAQIEINGGKFEAAKTEWTLNCKDNTTSKIIVKGGTFYNFDPSNTSVGEGEIVVPEGYRVAKNGTWYTVHKENTITVKKVEGGNVSVMPAKAIAGEIVSLTVKANDGYELDNITVIDSNGDTVKITDNEFVMPDSAVTVKAEFTKIIPPMDYVISGNETENSNIGIVETEKTVETLDTSLKANTELNKKVEEERQNGNQVTVEITMEELDEKSVNDEEKQEILQKMEKNQTVHQYFDISVLVRTGEKELGKLTELTEKMTFSMEIPKELIQEGRTFYIINLHNSEVKRIDAILNGTKLEFATAHFSTFALAYEDELPADDSITEDDGSQEVPGGAIQEPTEEPKEEVKEDTKEEIEEEIEEEVNVPNTGDNIILYVLLAIAALTGIVILKKVNSKK